MAIAIVLVLVGLWWTMRRSAESVPTMAAAAPAPPAPAGRGEVIMPAGCDPLPPTPALPATLTPSAPTVEAVVEALDAALSEAHKTFLRCFPNEDDLVARVHGGLGRWLRNTLHLFSDNALTASLRGLGLNSADQMSGVILRAYARSLSGQPLDLPTAVARSRAPVDVPEQP